MSDHTKEEVEEMMQEAIARTERSFGGTFKRLKSENEEHKTKYETAVAEHEAAKTEMEKRIAEFENTLSEKKRLISELTIRGELLRQIREKGPLPERFVDVESIEYSDDPETLRVKVAESIEKGREAFGQMLSELGISLSQDSMPAVNPTNPPRRDTKTAQNMKRSEAREVLQEMTQRGLIR